VGGEHRLLGQLFISNEILKHVVKLSRVRNTLRFLLANTSDFEAARHTGAGRRAARDRSLCARHDGAHAGRDCRGYERYQFHLVAQKLQAFCSEDLSAFFLDILKDRLTPARRIASRRAAQTAPSTTSPTACAADGADPELTAEELWQVLNGKRDDSVFFQTWPRAADARRTARSCRRSGSVCASCASVRKKNRGAARGRPVGSSLQPRSISTADGATTSCSATSARISSS